MSILKNTLRYVRTELILGALLATVAGLLQSYLVITLTHLAAAFMRNHMQPAVGLPIVLTIILIIVSLFSKVVLNRLNRNAMYSLQSQLSEQVLQVPYHLYEQLGKSRYYATLTQDVGNLRVMINSLPTMLNNVVMVLGVFVYLAWFSWSATLLALAVFVPLFLIYSLLDHFVLTKCFKRVRAVWDSWYQALRSLLEGKKELALYEQLKLKFVDNELKGSSKEINDENYKANNTFSFVQTIWLVAEYSVLIIILFTAPTHFNKNPSSLMVMYNLVMYAMGVLIALNVFFPTLRRAAISLQKIKQLGMQFTQEVEQHVATDNVGDSITLRSQDFSVTIQDEQGGVVFATAPVNAEFKSGQVSFIVGDNGAGKSTFIKGLVGLYLNDKGSVILNGVSIEPKTMEWYRSHFAVIFYDFHLFPKLLQYANEAQQQRFWQVLQELQIVDYVKVENGAILTHALSDGQRKRLALASAYLYDRPVMVFDEWASDQDPAFKQHFYEQLLPRLKREGKCVIAISHDEKYFSAADQVITLSRE